MIPTLIAVAMLFGCFIDGLPYGYFQILRWMVCGACAYRAMLCLESKHEKWMWFFVVVAILFNPIIPIHLDRDVWLLIDATLGITMLASLVILRKGEPKDKSMSKRASEESQKS